MIPITPLDEWTARRVGGDSASGTGWRDVSGVVRGEPKGAGRDVVQGAPPHVPLERSELERWQLTQLREVVAWVRERSPFYRELYQHVPADGPQSLDDLGHLPFVQEEDLRKRGLDLVCVSQGDIARIVTVPTSGTSGVAKRLWFTQDDLELTIDHFRHGMRALVKRGERVLVLMPGTTPGSVGDLLKTALARDGVEVDVHGFVDDCARAARHIRDFEADCLVGVPGQIMRLARSRAGRALPSGRVKAVLFSGDYVAAPLRAAVERSWGCSVFEHYGSTETGLGGAVQCRAFAGLHIREADLLFEVVDSGTGRVLPLGQSGELVVTTLTRRGMPLIRYRTGDSGRLLPSPCACGSVLRCLDRVQGRMSDVVDLGAGRWLSMAQLDEILFAVEWVVTFSAEVVNVQDEGEIATKDGGGVGLLVRVEAVDVPAPAELRALVEGIAALSAVQESGMRVEVEIVQEEGLVAPAKRKLEDSRRG